MSEPSPAGRMQGHLDVLVVANYILCGLGLLVAGVLVLVGTLGIAILGAAGAPSFLPAIVGAFAVAWAIIPLAYSVLALLAGLHLHRRRRSGRTLGLMTAGLSLLSFPVGTAYGIYAFWVLAQPETQRILVETA